VPRYFIHLFDQIWHIDREGLELPDRAAAQHLAERIATDLMRDFPETASPMARVRIEVEDETGAVIIVLKFVDVLDETKGSGAS
jgi:hypothetical protein